MRFEVLRDEDVRGKNRLSIFKRIHPEAFATDIVNSQLKKESQKIGVRLKVPYDEIKDEIIREELGDNPYIVQIENGVKVLWALEWPQEFEKDKETSRNLDILKKYSILKSANKGFHIPGNKKVSTVYYNQDRYVKVCDQWAKVSPIEWYYDEECQVLVSKKVLFLFSMTDFSGCDEESFDFEKSKVASFIHNKFEKEAMMDDELKDWYYFPFITHLYKYDDKLKEILFWESYNEKRKRRKAALEKLKNRCVSKASLEYQIIDDIMQLNEEDEHFVKKHIRPVYIVD